MKIKNKGKVHPSPSSSASHSSCAASGGVLSVMRLLPAAILALSSALSPEDREVLAYMITRCLDTTAPAAAVDGRKKPQPTKRVASPSFDCDCFDCYRSYWHRWDSSPNRELIHQAIEAFEDHLASGELSKNKNGGGGRGKAKRRERDSKMARRAASGQPEPEPEPEPQMPAIETPTPSEAEDRVADSPEDDVSSATPVTSPGRPGMEKLPEEAGPSCQLPAATQVSAQAVDEAAARRAPAAVSSHKGLARKVLPDVIGILNSRLWNLWGPNV